MWIELVSIFICLFAYWIWTSLLRPGKQKPSYWIDRGVPVFPPNSIPSQSERLKGKVPFHEFDLHIYQVMKRLGHRFTGQGDEIAPLFFVKDLDLVRSILVDDFDSWANRRTVDLEKTDPLFNKMLHQAKGQYWKDIRSVLLSTFTTGNIRRMYSIFEESSQKLTNFLDVQLKDSIDSEIEFTDCITRYTLNVIGSIAFGIDSKAFGNLDENSKFWNMVQRFQNRSSTLASLKFLAFSKFPKLYSALGIPLMDSKAINYFAELLRNIIEHRLKTGERSNDFIQLLLDTQEQERKEKIGTKEKILITQDLILAQSIQFFVSGFDTIKILLLFVAYELALNPDIQEKLYKEVQSVQKANNGTLNYDLVMKMEYLEKVVSETLRQYPPGLRTERVCTREYKLPGSEGIVLEKGSVAVVPIYGIHHDEEHYPNPLKFDPERFSPENIAKRHPFSFIPFGSGPRQCIANRFVMAEAKTAFAQFILKFKLEPCSKTSIPMKYATRAVYKPENGMWLKVTPRN